ncbi:unnamed protein product [Arabidopsis lyrata]|nr:unnamed protein product [Arabidopsis lyrata]
MVELNRFIKKPASASSSLSTCVSSEYEELGQPLFNIKANLESSVLANAFLWSQKWLGTGLYTKESKRLGSWALEDFTLLIQSLASSLFGCYLLGELAEKKSSLGLCFLTVSITTNAHEDRWVYEITIQLADVGAAWVNRSSPGVNKECNTAIVKKNVLQLESIRLLIFVDKKAKDEVVTSEQKQLLQAMSCRQ